MARPNVPDLSDLALAGAEFHVRVTPGARRVALEPGAPLRIFVREIPEDGRATQAALALLAQALGVAKSRLPLVRGAASRDKTFRLSAP